MQGQKKANPLGQFLSPEAMLTPGVAGALVMMITNGLALNFHTHRASTGLALSFVIGLLVLVAQRDIWLRFIYYVLNSLVIFTVALGSAGLAADTKTAWISMTGSAYAQTSTKELSPEVCKSLLTARGDVGEQRDHKSAADLDRITSEYCARNAAEKASKDAGKDIEKSTRDVGKQFFAPWKF